MNQNERKNSVGSVLKALAILTYIGGAILGIIYGNAFAICGGFSMPVALLAWISSFVSGTLLYGFSEVIYLLQDIKWNTFSSNSISSSDSSLLLATDEETNSAPAKEVKAVRVINEPPAPKVAVFPYRPQSLSIPVVCPFCGMVQRPDVNRCCECEAGFSFLEKVED